MVDLSLDNKNKVAFFDVDETIINTKSMFDFMKFFLEFKNGKIGLIQFSLYFSMLKFLAFLGFGRKAINRLYYRLYKGENYKFLNEVGERWYESRKFDSVFFIQPVIKRLRDLKSQGYEVVFVSGSFRACLDPLAKDLNVQTILCAELEVSEGGVTGRMIQQCIGDDKAMLIKKLVESRNARLSDCFAFGDHISDFPMLNAVGHPVVVPNCKALIEIADHNKWEKINYGNK
jgi:HAD superfamily hydrolase (TIGR01490 family)